MAKPIGLLRRGDRYYIQRRIPVELVPLAGKHFYKVSLDTSDVREAKRRLTVATLEFDRYCDGLRSQASGQPQRLPIWTVDQVQERISRYVEEEMRCRKADLYMSMSDPEARRDQLQESHKLIDWLSDPHSPNAQQMICTAARAIFGADPGGSDELWGGAPYDPSRDTSGENGPLGHFTDNQQAETWDLIRRALLELERRAIAVLESDYRRPTFDHAFAPAQAKTPQSAKVAVTLEQVTSDYLAEYPNRRSVKAKRLDKVKAAIGLVVEFFGPETPLSEIDLKRCRAFRNLLSELPSNLNKHFPNRKVSLEEVVTQSRKMKLPTLSWSSQDDYLGTFKDFVGWAGREAGWTLDLSEIKPIGEKGDPRDARDPFTTEQLTRIFAAPLFTRRDAQQNDSESVSRETRYWAPLIGLFTGMRLNEICQLEVCDIRVEAGVWYISVNADEPDKSVKTHGSKRRVPVHPELNRLGFIGFVEKRRHAGHKRVFPELLRSERGYYSDDVSKWFNRTFLPSVQAKSAKASFHSFRHTFRDAARRAQIPTEIAEALGGWTSHSGISGHYGSGNAAYTVRQLYDQLKKVRYAGLNLVPLVVETYVNNLKAPSKRTVQRVRVREGSSLPAQGRSRS